MAQVMQERYADESAESTAILKEIQNFLEVRIFRYAARVWMLEKVDDPASFPAITQDLASVVLCVVEPALIGPADSCLAKSLLGWCDWGRFCLGGCGQFPSDSSLAKSACSTSKVFLPNTAMRTFD